MKDLKFVDLDEAIDTSLAYAKPTTKSEWINIQNSIGRVLAQEMRARKNLPSFTNSAMDGFAIKHCERGQKLKIIDTIFAGDSIEAKLEDGCCYKVMTGGQVPDDADTIVPFEDTLGFDNEWVDIPNEIKKGNHLRKKAEELEEGAVIFQKGEVIDASKIAIFASQGITQIEVFSKISIAVISTGNELKEPWEIAQEYQIYNSNSSSIIALLREYNFDGQYVGVIPDNLEESIRFIEKLQSYDVVISTGGISMGEADFMAEAFEAHGLNVLFHGVNVKPGRPTMMGIMGTTYVMAMPGNPLTALINMYILGLPVVNKLSGASGFYHDFVYAKNIEAFKVKSKRANIVLGSLSSGEFQVTMGNKYGSGMLLPLVQSNCVVITSKQREKVETDELVRVVPLHQKLQLIKRDIYIF